MRPPPRKPLHRDKAPPRRDPRHDRRDEPRQASRQDQDLDQLEGRNPVYEALVRGRRRVHRVLLDSGARPEGKIQRILDLAKEQGVPVIPTAREDLDRRSESGVHNGVIALAAPLPAWSVATLLDDLEQRGVVPCIVLIDEPQYEQNLGAVLRSCLGAGVHGVIVPTARSRGLSPVVQRVAMGAAEEVPIIREGISSSLAIMKRRGFRVVGADMDGRPWHEVSLTGALALMLGGEDKGLTPPIRNRCDDLAGIPLQGQLESLNLSVTAGILLFERVRQMRALP